ncbi:MAG: type II secretion system GspH family protein [Desulfobacterales bacterium]|nr:type II secretion system GspH family protein [Desulfobacterales bacterium]
MEKKQVQKKKINNQKGFTLLEILVVLTIMGFLIAMVAPRLAGISGGAVDTVCDTNQNRMVTYMSSFFEQTNRYPNKLTNLVVRDDAAAALADYQIPVVSDQDPDNEAEVFANEFYSRNHLNIHYLTSEEAAVLRNMGIVKVFNLNDYSRFSDYVTTPADFNNDEQAPVAIGTEASAMEEVDVAAGVGVAMVGMGADGAATPAWTLTTGSETGWGEPEFFGRIVLGMGPECSLITSGVIANAAHCPGGIQNADNCTYNDYNLVVPRLEATIDSFDAAITAMDADGTTDGVQIDCLAYAEGTTPTGNYDAANTDGTYRQFTLEAQETWQFATMCPEGHKYPADDGDEWAIDLDASGAI